MSALFKVREGPVGTSASVRVISKTPKPQIEAKFGLTLAEISSMSTPTSDVGPTPAESTVEFGPMSVGVAANSAQPKPTLGELGPTEVELGQIRDQCGASRANLGQTPRANAREHRQC